MTPFLEFAREYLPPPPARVLDVGCGQGELTTALAVAGYDVLGIDPLAPQGDLFRRIRLEDLEEEERFDAVVAVRSLHPMRDLGIALDHVATLLATGSPFVVEELGWDLIDEPTLAWLYDQRRALAAAGHGEPPASIEAHREEWEASHLGIHGYDALRTELELRFEERRCVRTPFLHHLLGGVATEVLDQALIDAGAIQALGFRWAGLSRPS